MNDNPIIHAFYSTEFGEVRVTQIDGSPWFVGKDVALALGYKDTKNALKAHVIDEDKRGWRITTPSGTQLMTVINESGLYSMIFSSKLESALRFKHWVTSEVLPSIRKHGAYMSDSVLAQFQENPEMIYGLAESLLLERERTKVLSAQLQVAKPKAEYFDAFVNKDDLMCLTDVAKELGVPPRWFTEQLVKRKILFRRNGKGSTLLPSQMYVDKGFLVLKDVATWNGLKMVQQTMVTSKGKEYFRRLLEKGKLG